MFVSRCLYVIPFILTYIVLVIDRAPGILSSPFAMQNTASAPSLASLPAPYDAVKVITPRSLMSLYDWLKENPSCVVTVATLGKVYFVAKLPRRNDRTNTLQIGFTRKFSTLTHWAGKVWIRSPLSATYGEQGAIVLSLQSAIDEAMRVFPAECAKE